jgi:uncharacterized cupin superfamily protein
MRIPERKQLPEARIHPGRDWFYVLTGTVCLRLGNREILIPAGKAASFDTMTPHTMGGHNGPAEILSHHGERAQLRSACPPVQASLIVRSESSAACRIGSR